MVNTGLCLAAYQVALRSSVSHIETENMKTVSTGENVMYLFVYISRTDAVRSWDRAASNDRKIIVNSELKKRGSGRGLL